MFLIYNTVTFSVINDAHLWYPALFGSKGKLFVLIVGEAAILALWGLYWAWRVRWCWGAASLG